MRLTRAAQAIFVPAENNIFAKSAALTLIGGLVVITLAILKQTTITSVMNNSRKHPEISHEK